MKSLPLLIVLFFTTALRADDKIENPAAVPVEITGAWVRAVPPGTDTTAVYMKITNTGAVPLRLTGGESTLAPMVHTMVTKDKTVGGRTTKGMELVDFLEIPAHGSRTLAPGGDHIMLMGMKEQPAEGSTARLKLHFQPGNQTLVLDLPVARTAPR